MTTVDITNMEVATGPKHKLFKLKANGIELQVSCTLEEFHEHHEETMKKVNENFRMSIRYIKLYGKIPSKPDPKKLNVWTQTASGIACRGNKLPVPEFVPFAF